MAFSTTEGKIYLVELAAPFERLEFQFMPEKLSNPRKANIAEIDVVGRNLPKHQHTGGSETLAFTLDFYSDVEEMPVAAIPYIQPWQIRCRTVGEIGLGWHV